jgi:hypothetical protein
MSTRSSTWASYCLSAGPSVAARDLALVAQDFSPAYTYAIDQAYAAPTMIFLMRSHGQPCEMLLVCVG